MNKIIKHIYRCSLSIGNLTSATVCTCTGTFSSTITADMTLMVADMTLMIADNRPSSSAGGT